MDVHLLEVSKKIGTRKILSKINLTVNSGERRLIVGDPNSGKTSLLRVLLNIYKASEGFIYFDGVEVGTQMFSEKRKEMAFIPQGLIFHEKMSLYENLLFYDGIYFPHSRFKTRMQRVNMTLERVGLSAVSSNLAHSFDDQILSKLRLAQMMHFDHGLVIVDEPLFHESKEDESLLMQCLSRFRLQGTTVIMTSKGEIESMETALDNVSYLKAGGRIE